MIINDENKIYNTTDTKQMHTNTIKSDTFKCLNYQHRCKLKWRKRLGLELSKNSHEQQHNIIPKSVWARYIEFDLHGFGAPRGWIIILTKSAENYLER